MSKILLLFLIGLCAAQRRQILQFTGPDTKKSFLWPLDIKNNVVRERGLLYSPRNASLPLHGGVKSFGYYYVSIYLGTPPRKYEVIVDSGSTITYIPCKDCGRKCGNHIDAPYDPQQSSTYANIPCLDPKCFCGHPSCKCMKKFNLCVYYRSYAEKSSSSGRLIEDHMVLPDGKETVPIVFGCEHQETGEIYRQQADGILGLGRSDVSIPSQLAKHKVIEDTFSLCYGGESGGGALLLGEVPHTVHMEYTTDHINSRHPFYYHVQIDEMRLGDRVVKLDSNVMERGYGQVLDSGTTFTYLPRPVYLEFRRILLEAAAQTDLMRIPPADTHFNDLCFKGRNLMDQSSILHQLPALNFVMKRHNDSSSFTLQMDPQNYMFAHVRASGAYCVGIFDNGMQGTLLGMITFRDVLVEYDRRNKRIGFGKVDCLKLGAGAFVKPAEALPVSFDESMNIIEEPKSTDASQQEDPQSTDSSQQEDSQSADPSQQEDSQSADPSQQVDSQSVEPLQQEDSQSTEPLQQEDSGTESGDGQDVVAEDEPANKDLGTETTQDPQPSNQKTNDDSEQQNYNLWEPQNNGIPESGNVDDSKNEQTQIPDDEPSEPANTKASSIQNDTELVDYDVNPSEAKQSSQNTINAGDVQLSMDQNSPSQPANLSIDQISLETLFAPFMIVMGSCLIVTGLVVLLRIKRTKAQITGDIVRTASDIPNDDDDNDYGEAQYVRQSSKSFQGPQRGNNIQSRGYQQLRTHNDDCQDGENGLFRLGKYRDSYNAGQHNGYGNYESVAVKA